MKHRRRRKCLHCGELFRPDPRTADRQRHCSEPTCKKASKARSQKRWLSKPQNQDYFCGPDQVERVRQWRARNPGYSRRSLNDSALQDECQPQPTDSQQDKADLSFAALQEDYWTQPTVIAGLISHLTGSPLQEDMVRTLRMYHARGQSILGKVSRTQPIRPKGPRHDPQTTSPPRPPPPTASPI